MEKLKMHSVDIINDNVKRIGELFPECLTEIINDNDKLEKVVDFDKLKTLLSSHIAEGNKERYQFTWPDKSKARALANAPIEATLRPCREESVNFDTTENLYIEGDNLDILKLLRETYYGKVKMIYIDPPYNTGNDFVYEDDFSQDAETYKANSGQYDDQGNRLQKNQESNGRFHTDWLNMMYPRLKIARDLLSNDGVIFISIDDNEVDNLRKICDEIYGESNFVTLFVWEKKKKPSFLNVNIGIKTEYILCYSKDRVLLGPLSVDETERGKKYPLNNAGNGISVLEFPAGTVEFSSIKNDFIEKQDMSEGNIKTTLLDDLYIDNGRNVGPFKLKGEWRYSQDKLNEIISNGERIIISKIPFRPNHVKTGGEIKKMHNLLCKSLYPSIGMNEDATNEITEMFGNACFDHPKPVSLIKALIKSCTYDCYGKHFVMDFFSGSATTAHAVMQLNAEDGGNRKFIMVQLPEACDEKSEAYKAGYKNICEIGKERIRRAGKKILEEQKSKEGDLFSEKKNDLDVGFRVLKLDTSNMEEVYYHPEDLRQDELLGLISNIKAGRTDEDLLFQVMLDMGVLLSSKIETEIISGKKVFNVNKGYLMACFDENVDEGVITAVAKKEPTYFVMRDSSLANDSVSVNFDQIFEKYSKETTRKVL